MDEIKKLTSKNFFKTLLTLPDTIKLIFQLERNILNVLKYSNGINSAIKFNSLSKSDQ